jgi:hypothetical protein
MLGQLRQVVDLPPVQDPLTIRLSTRQHARGGTGGNEHNVGVQHLLDAVVRERADAVRGHPRLVVAEACEAVDDPHALPLHPVAHVRGLGQRETPHPAVHGRQVDHRHLVLDANAQLIGIMEGRAGTRGGDERLRRHAVVQHAGAAEPVPFDDRDFGSVLGGHQRRLVARRAATHDHDPGH